MRPRTTWSAILTGLILTLLTVRCSPLAPDEGELAGTVYDDTGKPVAGATVATSPGSRSAATNAAGRFVFSGLADGGYTLTASKAGYGSASVRADLPESGFFSCSAPEGDVRIAGMSLEGWASYEGGDIVEAVSQFSAALAGDPDIVDAYVGLGWSYAAIDSLDRAEENLRSALDMDPISLGAHAGLALVASAMNDHEQVITSATTVLGAEGEGYVFRHDSRVTSAVLRLVLAQSYWHEHEYADAQDQVDILDPDNGLDPATPATWVVDAVTYATYEEALLAEIELLGA